MNSERERERQGDVDIQCCALVRDHFRRTDDPSMSPWIGPFRKWSLYLCVVTDWSVALLHTGVQIFSKVMEDEQFSPTYSLAVQVADDMVTSMTTIRQQFIIVYQLETSSGEG